MRYSLINVSAEGKDSVHGFWMADTTNVIDGYWMQDCIGTLEYATEQARRTEMVNGNRIDVAVVEGVAYPSPLDFYTGHRRLDGKRVQMEARCTE